MSSDSVYLSDVPVRSFSIQGPAYSVSVGDGKPVLIAGPCAIESQEHLERHARQLLEIANAAGFQFILKSSYDKANRTSASSFRGLGIEAGLEVLRAVRQRVGVPVLTDIHSPEDARRAGEVVDVVQIPAFLCRQTDLLIAAGQTGKAINVKKGQFLAPDDMKFVAEKIASTGNERVMLCERGTCFGYRDLTVDFRALQIMRRTGFPVVFDATHSVQKMGGEAGVSGGAREFIPALARAAVAVGIDAIFLESHEDPANAPSDGPNMIRVDEMAALLAQLQRLWSGAVVP